MSPITGPGLGLGTWPARRARISPHAPALSDAERALDHAGLAERTARIAGGLARLGVGPGDRVAWLGVNAVATLETCFAAWRLGALAVPLNHRLAPAEVGYMLDDCGAAVLVHGADADALVAATAHPVRTVRGVEDLAAGPGADDAGAGLDDPAVLLYTSGTTGRPKAAVLTHGNLTWNTVNQLAHVDVTSDERTLCISPLFHCVGLSQVTLPTLFKGGSVELAGRFDPGAVLARVAAARITSFAAVPTMLQMLCEHPDWAATDLSSLRTVVYGGSPVQERVARAWLERGVALQQGYGMTEASPGVTMATREGTAAHPPTSVGVPHFFTDVAVERDGALVAPDGEPAELLVRGPHVSPGYWNRPEETAASRLGGWYRTGDVLRTGPDGWAHVVDRVKDLIISGGENVYPAEVEAVAVTHPDVADCAVVGVPDARWGEVGAAYVQLREGAQPDVAALTGLLAGRLARYKVPKFVRFVDELPRNASGKVRRVDLRAAAAADEEVAR
ncbi:acyl-CoA synthetase [Pseudonocardia spirodelae]|uniref:Long-chain fatty acid--CoA ligase n=1 Tax=Pseudonocardia spirodelae TaxID=3133431 RepID=A0ABU8TBD4_9PSEU